MKEKTTEIHIRVNENEKKKLQKNAKKSGLSLSAYMRKVALKQEIISIPDKNFYEIYLDICKVRNNIFNVKIETIEIEDCTPSYSQAVRMRELSKQNKLDMDTIFNIMIEEKANQKEQIKFKVEKLKDFFPKGYTSKQMQETIEKLLKQYHQKWKNRDLGR